jgi:hypothetical protein
MHPPRTAAPHPSHYRRRKDGKIDAWTRQAMGETEKKNRALTAQADGAPII